MSLSRTTLMAYSGITVPMAAMGMPIAVYLPRFYSEGMGLPLLTVGAIFTIARVWDVITDPLMGILIDKFDTRWGRRKHWIAISVPLLVLSVWMVFMPNPESVTAMYLLFWLILLYIGYTMLAISHQSWGAELTQTYDDRSRLFGWREIFVIGGMTIVLAIPAAMELTGQTGQEVKVASMGWFCLILFPLLVIPTLTMVPDSHQKPAATVPWKEALAVLVTNKLMWRLLITDLGAGIAFGVSGALYIFIAATYFKLPEHASLALLFFFLSSFIAMPLWMKVAYAVGKDRTLVVSLLYMAAINIALIPLAEEGNVIVLWGFTILFGVGFGAPPTLVRSMMADVVDEDELVSGHSRPALFFALLTTTNKLGSALAVGACFGTLDLVFGFVPGQENSPDALEGLLITYCLGAVLGLVAGYIPLIGYPLTKEVHADVRQRLEARAAA